MRRIPTPQSRSDDSPGPKPEPERTRRKTGEPSPSKNPFRNSKHPKSSASIAGMKLTKKQIYFYFLILVLAQVVMVFFFLGYFKLPADITLQRDQYSAQGDAQFKPEVVNYPPGYQPPCHIKSKEALSALNRAQTAECKRDLAEVSCKSEAQTLYAKSLPNLCPSGLDSSPDEEIISNYLGCFRDNFDNRLLQGSFIKLSANSRVGCVRHCSRSGFLYAGTQYGRECFCGNQIPSEKFLLEEVQCDKPCSGAPTEMCGGYLAMNLYQIDYKKAITSSPVPLNGPNSNDVTPPIRIVYLLTVNGRAVRQLRRLIGRLFDNQSYFYIHVDARQDYMFREMSELASQYPDLIRVTQNRYSTIWGGASLLRMLTSCMSELLAMSDWKWDFVINLSESDYPVKPSNQLIEFLSQHRTMNFVKSHGRDSQVFIKKQGLDRTFHECDTHMFRLGFRDLPEGIEIDGGSDWVCLNRKFLTYVVNGHDELLIGLRGLFNYTLLPAESFFHTTLKNSEFCASYVNNNLRMTNWKRHLGCKCQHKSIVDWCGCSPNDFLPDDWAKLKTTRAKDTFFARKFEPIVNQAILDMVDEHLLELPSKPELGYWQNIYHHQDANPRPDPAVMTLGQSLAESSIEVFGLKFSSLQQVTSFHYEDEPEGIVLTFEAALPYDKTQTFETFVRVKVPESSIDFRSGSIAVGTDFDPKELIFRNFFSAIGPLSKPVLTYEFSETLEEDTKLPSASIIWRDPLGQLVHRQPIRVLNTSAIHESVELKAKPPHLPGIWSVTFIVETSAGKNIAARIPFLITPYLPVNSELSNPDFLRRIHSQAPAMASSDQAFDLNHDEEAVKVLRNQAALNAQKTDGDLKEWIRELSASFFTIESVCHASAGHPGEDQQVAMLPKCQESEWSTFYPDSKSQIPIKNHMEH